MKSKVTLLLIDCQYDFCDPLGSLYVPGAKEDMERLITFMRRVQNKIGKLVLTRDSHYPISIFFPQFWEPRPPLFSTITWEDVENKIYTPLHPLLPGMFKPVTVWPQHCLKGSRGETIVSKLDNVVRLLSTRYKTNPIFINKGEGIYQEQYGLKTSGFLIGEEKIIVAGEAKSHCVLHSLIHLMNYFPKQLYILEDCMSTIPGFEEETEKQFAEFQRKGAHIVNTKNLDWIE